MLLLDLPPEMLERIIGHLVTGAGIVEGWKHRKVCRTFRRSIEFETLAKQPTRAFLHGKGESATKILKANTALYLSYRIMAEKKAYPFLPRFLKKICDAVSAQLPQNDHKTRWQYARVLCRLLVERKGSQIQRLLTTKNPENSSQSNSTSIVGEFSDGRTSDIVAGAAAVGELGALRAALGNTPSAVFNESLRLGSL